MNPCNIRPAMVKLGSFALVWQQVEENEKSDIKLAVKLERNRLHQTIPVQNTVHDERPDEHTRFLDWSLFSLSLFLFLSLFLPPLSLILFSITT